MMTGKRLRQAKGRDPVYLGIIILCIVLLASESMDILSLPSTAPTVYSSGGISAQFSRSSTTSYVVTRQASSSSRVLSEREKPNPNERSNQSPWPTPLTCPIPAAGPSAAPTRV